MVSAFAVHDLLRVAPEVSRSWCDAPDWTGPALQRAPWVVVRRQQVDGLIAVGVRGTHRAERFGTAIGETAVREVLRPDQLVARIATRGRLQAAYHETARAARACGLEVFPFGAFAFELASEIANTHATSDLDLLVPAARISRRALLEFSARCDAIEKNSGVRLDVEVAFGTSAFALREFDGARKLIAKTPFGPKLIACPL